MRKPVPGILVPLFLVVMSLATGCEASDDGTDPGGADAQGPTDPGASDPGASDPGGLDVPPADPGPGDSGEPDVPAEDSGATDPGSDPGGDGKGRIVCGASWCEAGTICCHDNPPKCIDPSESCAFGYASTVACDGAEDCGDGELCMDKAGSFPLSVACVAATDPYTAYCHGDEDCAGSSLAARCCAPGVMFQGMNKCLLESVCPAN